ncbi:MAG: excinuclease ABC subunit UvrC [Deltaproteobacteria bacterium]|nr:excinuclease ABC subunit UvrC [Deltaproteobacteria bacterium]
MVPNTSPLDSKIKGLAEEPGVYLMKDGGGVILYVGKAKNLKSRVSSYFQDTKDKNPRTELLVRKIIDFEVVLTDTEAEALVLECNLIKKYKPRFNVRLKDDKSYPYVRLDMNHPFPRLEYVRRVRKDGARYFGPFVSAYQIKDILRWAQKAFKLRDCSDNEFRNRSRPCILHQMGQCSGPCVGLIAEPEYHQSINTVLKLLDGKTTEVVKGLKIEMAKAAESEAFELAAELRDRIQQIDEITQQQKISDPEADFDRDIVQFARGARPSAQAVVVVMSVRDGRAVGVFQFPFEDIDPNMPDDEFVFGFMAQYYLGRNEDAPALMPKEVLLPEMEMTDHSADSVKAQAALLSKALSRRVDFRVPKRGEAANLVAMVKKTAEYHLGELATKTAQSMDDLIDVQKKLDLRKFPTRIECYDISHFQGEGTVASRVVLVDGKPEKSLYRHYHVHESGGGMIPSQNVDDFKSMREILGRRFENDHSLPDLVVVDGGKGQLSQAEAIFTELGVIGVELVSLAKARTESDFTDAEITASMERVFKPNQKNPIMLKPGTGAYRVLTQARNEAHRFAITFHRQVRDKRILTGKKR